MPTRRRSSPGPRRATRGHAARRVAADRALQTHRRVIAVLHHIATLALREQPLPAVLQEVVQEVSAATGFPIVAIEFYDAVGQCMEVAAATGLPRPAGQARLRIPLNQTLSGRVAQSGQIIETQRENLPSLAGGCFQRVAMRQKACK
jgi:hypothetical protein